MEKRQVENKIIFAPFKTHSKIFDFLSLFLIFAENKITLKVFTLCKKCSQEFSYNTEACTRIEFAMKEGESVKIHCPKCNYVREYTPNDFYAKHSKIAKIIALILLIVGTPLVIYWGFFGLSNYIIIGGFLLIPFAAYQIIDIQEKQRIEAFNSLKK